MAWPPGEGTYLATTTCFHMVLDDDGDLVPCSRPVAVSGWLCQGNVWNYVDACLGHGQCLRGSAET